MHQTIRAHFDGKVIVPDEPVDIPVGKTLSVQLSLTPSDSSEEQRQQAWNELMATAVEGAHIPDEELRRVNIYDRDRNRF